MPVRLAGRTVVDAFDGPVAEDLGRVLALAELGVAESEAWRTLPDIPSWDRRPRTWPARSSPAR